MSNLGQWTYNGTPFPYGSRTSYWAGAEWLADCATVEDWGCGAQWFREEMRGANPACNVRGIDGSPGCCDVASDLRTYRPENRPDGIFMRHVLEHDYDWRMILANAATSFGRKFCLILFTPPTEAETLVYDFTFANGQKCPVLSLPIAAILRIIEAAGGHVIQCITESSPGTEFSTETMIHATR